MQNVKQKLKRVFRKDSKKNTQAAKATVVKVVIPEGTTRWHQQPSTGTTRKPQQPLTGTTTRRAQELVGGTRRRPRQLLGGTKTIVCELGSGTTRMGFANHVIPQLELTSYVGRRQEAGPLPLRKQPGVKNFFVGDEAKKLRRVLEVSKPIKNGKMSDVDAVSFMLDNGLHAIGAFARTEEDLTGRNLLVTFRPSESKRAQERLFQTLMETYSPDGCFFALQQPLALLATGRATGLVLDSGLTITHAVPVYWGQTIAHAIQKTDLGGQTVTDALLPYLAEQDFRVRSVGDEDVVNEMKEKLAFVSAKPGGPPGNVAVKHFRIPEGRNIILDKARYECAEHLFRPHLIGRAGLSVAEAVTQALGNCDPEVRAELAGNIITCGGNSGMEGFDVRLEAEVKRNYAGSVMVRAPAVASRPTLGWSGGAALARTEGFRHRMVTAVEYAEHGMNAFRRKCF